MRYMHGRLTRREGICLGYYGSSSISLSCNNFPIASATNIYINAKEGQTLLMSDHKILPQIFTAGDDYIFMEKIIIFAPGRESVECLNVTIVNDDIFEASESFVLSLNVEYESVPVKATVYIIDDERKLHVYAYQFL